MIVDNPPPVRGSAPVRQVARVLEVDGPRGGRLLVLVLDCGHWLTRRHPATEAPCIGCFVAEAMRGQ